MASLALGKMSLSSQTQIVAFEMRWNYEILHPISVSPDIICEAHLERVREKYLVDDKSENDKHGYHMKEILKRVLLHKQSYQVEDQTVMHVEYGKCIWKKFTFLKFYTVAARGNLFDPYHIFKGDTRTTVIRKEITGKEVHIVYLSSLNETYYKVLDPDYGLDYVQRHELTLLPVMDVKKKEDGGSSSGSGHKTPIIISPSSK
ncbi:TPA_asm: M [Artemisia betacytorhabdovirus 1]|nr:TPA_asm: M [Artemisia betacytorhabdovirus 1]